MNGEQDSPESETSEPSPEAGVVCTACLAPNPPHTDYCSNCGALLNSLTAFNPFDQTLIEGFAYRRAVDGPPNKVILIGIWLLFGSSILLIPVALSDARLGNPSSGLPGDEIVEPAFDAYSAGHLLISIVILYRTTANYITKRKTKKTGDA